MPKTVWLGHYEYKYGDDYTLHSTEAEAIQRKAGVARDSWADRQDEDAPEDHSGLSDDEVIDAYFGTDGDFHEHFAIVEVTLPA